MKRLWNATLYSIYGIQAAWKDEPAFRQEIFLLIILGPLGWWLGESALERAILIAPLFLVLAVELINSAIEACIDRIGEDIHPLSKKAKDTGSAAVLVTLVMTAVLWAGFLVDKY
ncbi:MAG: diacylglycerol kinase [Rhodospirillales bacterium]|jgi:diacylglycerol kinase (ATP)|nr:diacylglycerol kinase [Rhodospirillales bacterium]